MKIFSQRKNFTPVPTSIQLDYMSDELRISLWNVLDLFVWRDYLEPEYSNKPKIYAFSDLLWFAFFKKPVDKKPLDPYEILATIRSFFFGCEWFEVYDFLEFVVASLQDKPRLADALNHVLEKELSGYRIVSGKAVNITDKEEVEMLEETLRDTQFNGVTAHLKRAFELLSDRNNPDYRNSIKESISAVESMARIITGENEATLGNALKALEKQGNLHPALKNGFSSLYGYTSDEQGIRHSMLEEPDLTATDAKFFLLSCTSFVNYLKAKLNA